MNFLIKVVTSLRNLIFFCNDGLLKSRYLYCNLNSSLVLIFSSTGNGGVSDSDKMRSVLTVTSISPVAKSSLIAPPRFLTTPSTAITNSLLRFLAFSKTSLSFSSNTNWRIPDLSLKSIKIRLPKFLLFWTQPITVTVSPIFLLLTSVHLWLLWSPCIDSAITFPPILTDFYKIP